MSLSFSPQMNQSYAAAAAGCQRQRSQADRQAVTDRPVTVRQSANYSANGIDLTSLGAESPTNDARAENGKAGYRPGQQVESLEAQAPTTRTSTLSLWTRSIHEPRIYHIKMKCRGIPR